MLPDWKPRVLIRDRRTAWIASMGIAVLGIIGCSQEVVDVNRSPSSIADGVSREDSIAAGALRKPRTQALELSTADECSIHQGLPNTVEGCVFPVPSVDPASPWLDHSETSPDTEPQTLPITVQFARGIKRVHLHAWGALSCSGDPGRVEAYREGAQVYSAANSIANPDDCGEDDQTGLVVNDLPPDLMVDRLVIYGVNPWTYTHPVTGNVGHARLMYTITWPSDQGLNVVCTPSNPTRGESVQCKTSLKLPESYTVVWRSAFGADFNVDDPTSFTHAPGDTNTWEGIAVAPTDVQVFVELTVDGRRYTLNNFTHFDVQPRAWPTWRLTNPAFSNTTVVPGFMTPYPLPDTTDLGVFQVIYPDTRSEVAMPTSRPTGGPNQGLLYIRDPMAVTDYLVRTHPALYPPTTTTPAGAQQWQKDQNGKGSGTCKTWADINALAANVERHEGRTMAQNSHFGVANTQFEQLQLQMVIEGMYSQKPDGEFRADVSQKLTEIESTGQYAAAHKKFDADDRDNLYTVPSRCIFDFNPDDR